MNFSKLNFAVGTTLIVASTLHGRAADKVAPDNTAVNKVDRNPTLKPEDQTKSTDADLEVTRKIRQLLVSEKNLSTDAKNIKIITLNGVVNLRGVVETKKEEKEVEKIAKSVAGRTYAVRTELKTKEAL